MPVPKKPKQGRLPKQAFPNEQERFYLATLQRMVDGWENAVEQLVFPALQTMLDDHKLQTKNDSIFTINDKELLFRTTKLAKIIKFDSDNKEYILDVWSAIAQQVIESLQLEMTKDTNVAINFLDEIGQSTAHENLQAWHRITKQIVGVPGAAYQPWVSDYIASWVNTNTQLIKTLQANTIKNVELTINTAIKENRSIVNIKKELIEKNLAKSKSHAELLARDQVGKFNAELTKARQESIGVSIYIWNDSDDDRVRPKHSVMDGLYCNWDDSTVYADTLQGALAGKWKSRSSIGGVEKHPGMDYQCRCWAEAVLEGLI